MMEVDDAGLDAIDRKMLLAIIHNYQGGPVGLDTIAAVIGEEPDTIEDVYEPYLLQIGFLQRTPRGRMATLLGYEHLGLGALYRADSGESSRARSGVQMEPESGSPGAIQQGLFKGDLG